MGCARSAARQGGENRLQGSDHPGGCGVGRRSFAQRHRGVRLASALQARARGHQDPNRARLWLHARGVQGVSHMARSLRAHLLRLLLPPIAALLAVGAVVAYYPSMEPATEAYNQALVDIGIALGSYVRTADPGYSFD